MKLSVMFFSSQELDLDRPGYDLMLEVAKMADSAGFTAIWTPERHFDQFGALFPNPALTSAALAMITNRLQLRAGSVVSPLHNVIRLVEDWLVVDNLSAGRAAVSFASGWHPNDFVLAPDNYANRSEIMFSQIAEVRDLWRNRQTRRVDPSGRLIDVALYPPPVQDDLPIWVTSGGSIRTFEQAGRLGANLLTHLISQNISQLADRISKYRNNFRANHGAQGIVSLMLHTYVGDDIETVRAQVRAPMKKYLSSAAQLARGKLSSKINQELPADAIDEMLEIAFDRYFDKGSLLGTEEKIIRTLDQFEAVGVDEVACLVDFGMPYDLVLRSMERLCCFSLSRST